MQKIRYNYATRPKVVTNSNNRLKQILQTGNVSKIEKMVRDGYGYRLIGEYSSDPKIRKILKSVPFYMARIDMLHEAVTKGQLRDVQVLLNNPSPAFSLLKPKAQNLVLSKDSAGVGLLHKAVYYDYLEIIEWLIRNYPETAHVRDKLGRIPLHYVNSTSQPRRIWDLLVAAGSPIDVEDTACKTPRNFLDDDVQIHLPGKILYDNLYDDGIIVKPSNIRIWIHDQDIARLQQVIWEGHGEKLRTQTSNKPLMKKFLDGVPYIMMTIRQIHKATIDGDENALKKLCKHPVPSVVLKSKDTKGLTPLHKASGLGNVKIVAYILNKCPEALHINDNEGRTAIHYAAIFRRSQIYETLLKAGANENVIDKNGKTAKYFKSKPGEIEADILRQLPPGPRIGSTNPYPPFDWAIVQPTTSQGDSQKPLQPVNKLIELPFSSTNNDQPSTVNTPDDPTESLTNVITEQYFDNVHSPKEPLLSNQRRRLSAISEFGTSEFGSLEMKNELASSLVHLSNESNSSSDCNENTKERRNSATSGESTEKEDIAFKIQQLTFHYYQNESVENDSANLEIKSNDFDDKDDGTNESEDNEYQSDSTVRCDQLAHSQFLFSRLKSPKLLNAELPPTNASATKDEKFIDETKLRLDAAELQNAVDRVIKNENLDEIGNFILNGFGELLLNVQSENRQIQEFLEHLPIYLKKIELIHYCCKIGNLDELQKFLDRRKFAIARENKTRLYLTPLHVACVYNRRTIARYLGGRFPETFKVADKLGRTPLHFASVHPDGKFLYSMMVNLGADKTIQDKNGHTPQFYNEHPNKDRYHQLLTVIKNSKPSMDASVPLEEITDLDRSQSAYIASVLGEALKTGLSAIIHIKPPKPIKFLADYLNEYKEETTTIKQRIESADTLLRHSPTMTETSDAETTDEHLEPIDVSVMVADKAPVNQFQPISRDKYGQTMIHFAAARQHSRNSFLHMLQELNASIAYRDELYRTARDVAALSEHYDNVKAIDAFVLHIAANGETDKIINLMTDGYDHILEIETYENIIDVVARRNQEKMLTILRTIPTFEEVREKLHSAIRRGDKILVNDTLKKCGKDAQLLATCKNDTFRCSLHISVLAQRKDIVKFLVKKFPETLHIGDNLERTPLHYAMALEAVEDICNILIRAGAKRIVKDLKGRQPSYYFMNRMEIIQMREEEMYLNHDSDYAYQRNTQ